MLFIDFFIDFLSTRYLCMIITDLKDEPTGGFLRRYSCHAASSTA